MRTYACCLLISLLAALTGRLPQQHAKSVNLIQIIATPQKFDQSLVRVRGYLVAVGGNGDIEGWFLYLDREDASNLLGNEIAVVPTEQMRRDKEKLNHMYVLLSGVFHAVPAADGSYGGVVKDVQSCTVWSDPAHPIGSKLEDKKFN